MNYASFIVKIIENPIQKFFNDDISVTEVRAKFSQNLTNNVGSILVISVWGNLAYDVVKYYQINDYIVIEGYLSFRNHDSNDKQIQISVFKIYPLILTM